jgi:nucleoside-diphosphate-sugar epimerase
MKICITGSNGKLGSALVNLLLELNHTIIGIGRRNCSFSHPNFTYHKISDNFDSLPWDNILCDVDVLIHCAAILRNRKKLSKFMPIDIYKNNVIFTEFIARKSIACDVKKFIFISSISVLVQSENYDNDTFGGIRSLIPSSDYSHSKILSELLLANIFDALSGRLIIIRPPYIFTIFNDLKFYLIFKYIKLGFPLPFKGFTKRLHFICMTNILLFINECINRNFFENKIFNVSDLRSFSIYDFFLEISSALKVSPNFFTFPLFQYLVQILISKDVIINPNPAFLYMNWFPPSDISNEIKVFLSKPKP